MSIYGTIFDLEDDPAYRYNGSHVLPHENSPRDLSGIMQLAEIPSHITRDGRDDRPEDGTPWLRLSVGHEDVVLHARKARTMHEVLGAWLGQVRTREAEQ